MAIAAAGAVIGINPFDQPDVEASKNKTRELTKQYEKSGALPEEKPMFRQSGVTVYGDPSARDALGKARTLGDVLRFHLGRIGTGDYFALLAYVENSDAHHDTLNALRMKIRNQKHVATCLGFGPRYLHSTGQDYKGGPNSGVFLTITSDHASDLAIPGRKASFGMVEISQALGDFAVLTERGRRALRIHVNDLDKGLAALSEAFDYALE
jgi:transaldolase/glucose-6-phosphate isomerase